MTYELLGLTLLGLEVLIATGLLVYSLFSLRREVQIQLIRNQAMDALFHKWEQTQFATFGQDLDEIIRLLRAEQA